jgi:short-subunit dehydrogenase
MVPLLSSFGESIKPELAKAGGDVAVLNVGDIRKAVGQPFTGMDGNKRQRFKTMPKIKTIIGVIEVVCGPA